MGITKSSLSGKIKSNIESLYGAANDQTMLTKFCDAVAQAVVDEIHENATVSSTGTVTAGVASGSPVSTNGTIS